MSWKLLQTAKYKKDLQALSPGEQSRIKKAVSRMVANPGGAHIVKLGKNLWRLRVGDWRVFVQLDAATGSMIFLSISRRTTTTY